MTAGAWGGACRRLRAEPRRCRCEGRASRTLRCCRQRLILPVVQGCFCLSCSLWGGAPLYGARRLSHPTHLNSKHCFWKPGSYVSDHAPACCDQTTCRKQHKRMRVDMLSRFIAGLSAAARPSARHRSGVGANHWILDRGDRRSIWRPGPRSVFQVGLDRAFCFRPAR